MKLGFQNKKQKVILFVLGVEMLILLVLIGTLFIPEKSYVLSDRENSITLPYGHYFLNCEYSISSDTDYANYLYILNDSFNVFFCDVFAPLHMFFTWNFYFC